MLIFDIDIPVKPLPKTDAPKVCKKGLPCGKSCISKSKTCRKKYTPGGAVAAENLKTAALGAAGGVGEPAETGATGATALRAEMVGSVAENGQFVLDELDRYDELGFQERYQRMKNFAEENQIATVFSVPTDSVEFVDDPIEMARVADDIRSSLSPELVQQAIDQRNELIELVGEAQVDRHFEDSLPASFLSADEKFERLSALSDDDKAVLMVAGPLKGADGYTSDQSRNTTIATSEDLDLREELPSSWADSIGEGLAERATDENNDFTLGDWGDTAENATASHAGTVLHEMGHQVQYEARRQGITLVDDLPDTVANQVSGYAAADTEERFAEAFLAWMVNPGALQSNNPELYEAMEQTVNQVMP